MDANFVSHWYQLRAFECNDFIRSYLQACEIRVTEDRCASAFMMRRGMPRREDRSHRMIEAARPMCADGQQATTAQYRDNAHRHAIADGTLLELLPDIDRYRLHSAGRQQQRIDQFA